MPASPVCLDTLVLATVGAAKNLLKLEAIKNLFPAAGASGRVGDIADSSGLQRHLASFAFVGEIE